MKLMRTPFAQGLVFAVFWTAAMLLWRWPLQWAQVVILVVCGILIGVAFGWIAARKERR